MTFSGSYHRDDVTFLLKPVQLETIEISEKERLIQTGRRHYSEMISPESLPSSRYLAIFHDAHARAKPRFARDLLVLANQIANIRTRTIALVSLARAGTPIGVLVVRTLRRLLGREATHYSVSIIRDRGIDENALRYILARESAESIVFLDGWTGKGVIARELRQAITTFHRQHGARLDEGLYTVADLCGEAAFAASADDYLIPSSILGATVSGLVSRSILNDTVIEPQDYHGCLHLESLAPHDLSRWFVDDVFAEIERQAKRPEFTFEGITSSERVHLRNRSETFLADIRSRYRIRNVNHVKPGVGEATRVLLRRVPDILLIRDAESNEVAHLLQLAGEKNVPIVLDPALPYAAAAIIKEMDG